MLKELAPTYQEMRRHLPGAARAAWDALTPYRGPAGHLAALAVVYFATRLLFLTSLPIFCDEAIYLHWGQIVGFSRKARFVSHTDGKPPLHSWLLGAAVRHFDDPLVAGRVVSVLAGAIGLAGVVAAAWLLFRSRRAGLAAGWLYVLSPFCLYYDRLAVPDALLAAIGAWALLLSVLLARRAALSSALLLGLLVGIGLLTKQPAILFLLLAPAALLDDVERTPRALARWVALAAVAYALARLVNGVQFLSPKVGLVAVKQYWFAAAPHEWRTALLDYLPRNIVPALDVLFRYLTPIPFLLAALAVVWSRRSRPLAIATLWGWIPILATMASSRIIPIPRHLLIGMPGLLLAMAGAGVLLWERCAGSRRIRVAAACVTPLVLFDALLIVRPVLAPLPHLERLGALENNASGYGVAQVVRHIEDAARRGPVDVVTYTSLGPVSDGLRIYFPNRRDVRFFGVEEYHPNASQPPPGGAGAASAKPPAQIVYLVLERDTPVPRDWDLHEVARYVRPGGHSALVLYQVSGVRPGPSGPGAEKR